MWARLPVVTVAAGVLAAYLALGLPLSGVLARRERHHEPDLQTVYRRAICRLWLLAGLATGLAGLAGVPVAALGLCVPSASSNAPGIGVDAVLLAATVTTLAVLAGPRPTGRAASLLPRTPVERRLYAGVALTAGTAEELLFRGFLMLYLTAALGWSLQTAAAASALAFGISHLYQGTATALAGVVIGYGFAEAYAVTGSLLVPVVVHIALDLRVLRTAVGDDRRSVVQQAERALETVM